jgi:hypothetical protein
MLARALSLFVNLHLHQHYHGPHPVVHNMPAAVPSDSIIYRRQWRSGLEPSRKRA